MFKTGNSVMPILKSTSSHFNTSCQRSARRLRTNGESIEMGTVIPQEGFRKRRKIRKQKSETTSLRKLCRAVIIKNMGLVRLRRARKDLSLPRDLYNFLWSASSFAEFEIKSDNLSRDMRIHRFYPTRSLLDNSKVVLKCIDVKSTSAGRSMLRTVKTWAEVNHRNIMKVLLWFTEKDTVGIVLEPFPKSLHQLIQDYRKDGLKLCERLLWKMIYQICDVLLYLQRKKIVPPDIETKTLSLTNNGDILLHNLLVYTPSETELNVCVDVSGSFSGIFVAPERIKGQRYLTNQDSWSLGCVVYELMYLEPAFSLSKGDSMFEVLRNIVNGVLPLKLGEADCYSSDVVTLVVSCLMEDPRLRPTTQNVFDFAKERLKSPRKA